MPGRGSCDLEVKLPENIVFHLEDVFLRVSIVRDVDKVLDGRRVDVFVFGSDEHRCDANQLEVLALDLLRRKVPIDDIASHEQRVWIQLEFVVHFDEPVDENSSHLLVDVSLPLHVAVFRLVLLF